jgi:hypothetical protein
MLGTTGDENVEEFKAKRERSRELVKAYLQEFADSWGSVQCRALLEMDEGIRAPSGTLRSEGTSQKICDDYVEWSTKKISEIRSSINNDTYAKE